MTQQNSRRPIKRPARAGRNRPELVTSTSEVTNDTPAPETNQPIEETLSDLSEQSITPPSPTKRLASFFSTVGRSQKTSEEQETEVAQARLARATRNKTVSTIKETPKTEVREPVKASTPARSTPARPPSPFKTKYLLGIAIYLFGAQFIGIYENQFLNANHLNTVLGHPFGFTLTTATVVYLITLLLLLILLARLDLVPRSFGALSGQQTSQNRRGSSNNQGSGDNVKTSPPTMRQGVSGADDDLYQEYRWNQRRTKKK
jgi:hypothetical protein